MTSISTSVNRKVFLLYYIPWVKPIKWSPSDQGWQQATKSERKTDLSWETVDPMQSNKITQRDMARNFIHWFTNELCFRWRQSQMIFIWVLAEMLHREFVEISRAKWETPGQNYSLTCGWADNMVTHEQWNKANRQWKSKSLAYPQSNNVICITMYKPPLLRYLSI